MGGGLWPDGLANEALHWLIEKAEQLGLEFNGRYLEKFRPCFNSVLNDSMTLTYRVMGAHLRPIGEHLADGEAIHQSALDRSALAECRYDPPNLRQALTTSTLPIRNTSRVPRGTPCPPLD